MEVEFLVVSVGNFLFYFICVINRLGIFFEYVIFLCLLRFYFNYFFGLGNVD